MDGLSAAIEYWRADQLNKKKILEAQVLGTLHKLKFIGDVLKYERLSYRAQRGAEQLRAKEHYYVRRQLDRLHKLGVESDILDKYYPHHYEKNITPYPKADERGKKIILEDRITYAIKYFTELADHKDKLIRCSVLYMYPILRKLEQEGNSFREPLIRDIHHRLSRGRKYIRKQARRLDRLCKKMNEKSDVLYDTYAICYPHLLLMDEDYFDYLTRKAKD